MGQKTVIVTGGVGAGAGASGRYITAKLANEGYYVVMWDTREDRGMELVAMLQGKGLGAAYVNCDVCDEEQVKHAVRKTYAEKDRIDGLVNNAFWHADEQPPLHEVALEDWDKHIEINLRSHFIVCKHVIPYLLEQPKSAIVNISTTGCHRGEDGFAAYAAAKAGLESLTRSIAAQYGRDGLRCNCVVPGLTVNRQLEAMLPVMPATKEAFDRLDRQSLLAGGHGDGTEVADAVHFLMSDASRWITGENLVLDGGALSHSPSWADGRL